VEPLDDEQLTGIAQHLSGLLSAIRDDDEEAKHSDLLILRAQLCTLNAEPGWQAIATQRSVDQAEGLGLFVHSLVGLDRATAVEAMLDFLNNKTLCANQIEFINMIIEYLIQHGAMTAAQLYESPFTDIAPPAGRTSSSPRSDSPT